MGGGKCWLGAEVAQPGGGGGGGEPWNLHTSPGHAGSSLGKGVAPLGACIRLLLCGSPGCEGFPGSGSRQPPRPEAPSAFRAPFQPVGSLRGRAVILPPAQGKAWSRRPPPHAQQGVSQPQDAGRAGKGRPTGPPCSPPCRNQFQGQDGGAGLCLASTYRFTAPRGRDSGATWRQVLCGRDGASPNSCNSHRR